MGGLIRQYLGQGGSGLRQSMNLNFNYSHQAADELSLFPDLGGKQQTHQYSLALGYSLGKGRMTTNLRSQLEPQPVPAQKRLHQHHRYCQPGRPQRTADNPLLYGLPNLTLNQFTSVNEQQPNFQTNQTIAATDSTSWIHKKHNIRFGGDFRRVHNDLFGNTGNVTGTFTFTGFFTQQPGSSSVGPGGTPTSGSSLADLLLGLPQQTSLQAPYQKSYLRQNAWDAYAQDSWRALPNLTLLFGLRYEYFSPYSEKYDRLSTLDTGNNFTSVATVVSGGIGPYTGKYPRDLIYPEHNNFSPRIGIAVRAVKDTVVRAGFGINYAVGQYAKFIQDFAFQPPYADVQTNEAHGRRADQSGQRLSRRRKPKATTRSTSTTGFPTCRYGTSICSAHCPWASCSTSATTAPRVRVWTSSMRPAAPPTQSLSGVFYDYEDSVAFSNYNALTVSARKRLQRGIAHGRDLHL